MNNEALEILYSNIEQKYLVALVGENMSGKSSLIKEIRDYSANNQNTFVLHIDAPKNRIIFKHSNEQAIEIRIDDISGLFSKVFQVNTNLPNIDICYEEIINCLNQSIKLFDQNIFISCQNADKKDNKKDIRRHIDRILKTYLGIKDISEIDENKLMQWRISIDKYINDSIIDIDFSEKNTCHEKVFYIKYNQQEHRKITQVSSGLQILTILLFIVELVKYFHSDNLRFFLIIDEPESYLHPKWQKEFLSYLLSIINQNIKVLFATHSQYMIPTDNLDCIGIVTRSDEKGISYKNISDFIQQPISSASNVDRINILQPVEDALGFQFDIFSAPFLTGEGEEERKIFEKLRGEIKVANIINLKGSNNILPYLLASRMYENYKGVFLLDADVDINTLIKGIGNPQLLIASLKDKILFIGKSIYNFEEFYQKIDSDDCIYYERKQDYDQDLTNECLEDFIATNIFESEFEGYKHLVKIAEEVISEFLSTHSDLKVKNPKRALECFLEKENKDKKFKVMVDCILKNITHENSQLKTDLHKKLKTRLKTKILDDTLNNRDLNKLSELISRINQKFLN
jgi:energy-coupling factor transporter ATP-binding protein EcfA2